MSPHNAVTRRQALLALSVLGSLAARAAREPAPRFRARSLDGEQFDNDSIKGRVVLVQFWATWCPYCRREQGIIDSLVRDLSSKGLLVLAVNVGESRKKVAKYLQDSPRACKVVLTDDTNLAALFAPRTFPAYVVIGSDGGVAGRQNGAAGEDALRQLLAKAGLDEE